MSERTLICVANELESNGLKLSVKVTPVLFSNVKVELAPEGGGEARAHDNAKCQTRHRREDNSSLF